MTGPVPSESPVSRAVFLAPLEQRIVGLEDQLGALRGVPQQLCGLAESLTQLNEVPQKLGTVLELLSELQAYLSSDSENVGHVFLRRRTWSRLAVKPPAVDISVASCPVAQPKMLPLIGSGCRRTSAQSDDPHAMGIYQQRRPSNGSAGKLLPPETRQSYPPCRRQSSKSSGAHFTKRASTHDSVVSERSSKTLPISEEHFETVVPNQVLPLDEEKAATHQELRAVSPLWEADIGMMQASPIHSGSTDARRCSRRSDHPLHVHKSSSLSLGGDSEEVHQIRQLVAEDKVGDGEWVLHPRSCVRTCWDLLMVLITLLVFVVVPLSLTYCPETSVGRPLMVLLNVVSVAWLVDIAFNFRTGFFQSGKVVRSPLLIGKRYLRTWFVPDLIAVFPLLPASPAWAFIFCVLKLTRVVRLGPLIAGRSKDPPLLSLPLRVGITVLLITHTITCLWRIALRKDGIDVEGAPWWELYVADAYWVTMTMSTVGFGDIVPIGTVSQLFAIFAMLVAPLFFGTIVSLLTHITHSIFNNEIEAQVKEVVRCMRHRRLPSELVRRVQNNLRHQLNQDRLTFSQATFAKLSTAMQREVSLELLRSSVLNFPLFRGALRTFIAELAQAHSWVFCFPGDVVMQAGQLMQEVVFVVHGRLIVAHGSDQDDKTAVKSTSLESKASDEVPPKPPETREVELLGGAWFGEAALFFTDRIRSSTVYAASESELAVLQSSEYHRIVQKYPRLLERHESIQKALRMGSLSLKEVAYSAPKEQTNAHWTFQGTGRWWVPWQGRPPQQVSPVVEVPEFEGEPLQ